MSVSDKGSEEAGQRASVLGHGAAVNISHPSDKPSRMYWHIIALAAEIAGLIAGFLLFFTIRAHGA